MERNYARVALPLLAAGFLGTLAFRTLVPAVAFLVSKDLGAGVAGAAAASAAFVMARSVTAVFSGWLYDRAGWARRLPAVSFVAFSLITLLFAFADSPWKVAALKAAQGILSGLSWPLVQVALALAVPEKVRGRVLSVYFALGSAAGLLANLVYASIAQWPVESQLVIPAALYLCTALAYSLSRAAPRVARKQKAKAAPQAAVIGAAFAVSVLCSFAFGEVSYALLSSIPSTGRGETALLVAAVTAGGIVVSYLLNWAADAGFEAQALIVTVAGAVAAPAALLAGGVWVFAGYVLAVASQMSFKPLSRRYLASKSGTPGLAVGAVNAASNVGTCVGQLVIALVSV